MPKLKRVDEIIFPTEFGDFDLITYSTNYKNGSKMEYALAILAKPLSSKPLVRVHSQCIFGDVFKSKLCDCNNQLKVSLNKIKKSGGILIYLDQEGRGHGIVDKTRELKLQQVENLDTVEASVRLGLEVDSRRFEVVGDILKDLGIDSIILLTNNPRKVGEISGEGINVDQKSLNTKHNKYNLPYLKTKKEKLKHTITL